MSGRSEQPLDAGVLTHALERGVRQLFGDVRSPAAQFEVLSFDAEKLEALVRCADEEAARKTRAAAALSMALQGGGALTMSTVHMSPFLAALSV